MPTSNDTRVRVDGFSKISASVLPSIGRNASGFFFNLWARVRMDLSSAGSTRSRSRKSRVALGFAFGLGAISLSLLGDPQPVKLCRVIFDVLRQRRYHAAVVMFIGIVGQHLDGFAQIEAWAVRARADKGDEGVGNRENTGGREDFIAFKSERHAGAVIALQNLLQCADDRTRKVDDRENIDRGQDAFAHALQFFRG